MYHMLSGLYLKWQQIWISMILALGSRKIEALLEAATIEQCVLENGG